MNSKIVVIGSSNTDMVLQTSRLPKPGETILGGAFFVFQGGKGANQAVAAARLGGDVSFICRVGNDAFGKTATAAYKLDGIDVSAVSVDPEAPTGVAVIAIDAAGENSIMVASGANAHLSVKDLLSAESKLSDADWILTQLETPLLVIEFLAAYATTQQKRLILNPAPAAELPAFVYDGLFLITPNETETELLTGVEVTNEQTALQAALQFISKGVRNVIITLGSKGAYVYSDTFRGMIAPVKVPVVDSTAAGDVFNGALAVALARGASWQEAAGFACKAAALSVTRMGAQSSAPTAREVELFALVPHLEER